MASQDPSSGAAPRPWPGPPPRRSRLARKIALQLLFQRDLSGGRDDEQPGLFLASFSPDSDAESSLGVSSGEFKEAWPLAVRLYLGVARNLEALDAAIDGASANWRLDRMSAVDRALIRLGCFEMRFRPNVPVKVCLNEAVELAKGFGNSDSQAFVNGVLGGLARALEADGLRDPAASSGSARDGDAAGDPEEPAVGDPVDMPSDAAPLALVDQGIREALPEGGTCGSRGEYGSESPGLPERGAPPDPAKQALSSPGEARRPALPLSGQPRGDK
ncbi:MAG: transcription antitermination factor NusB [Deltaproteobacteria bacterium]|jgi:N utilization substance protein B|nr:transcription antitermination factor NusB [Deltaproteobacteria bacterium]